jgi:VIT1/CCC1 family predicted Fe2+/Mn2+ transporter
MALGEYVSVSGRRDGQLALLAQEEHELGSDPDGELNELAVIYQAKGLSAETGWRLRGS